jgi:hypothetical protein
MKTHLSAEGRIIVPDELERKQKETVWLPVSIAK